MAADFQDSEIKRQDTLLQMQEHQNKIKIELPPASSAIFDNKRSGGILYNAIVYMALFGLIAGICAGIPFEILYNARCNNPLDKFNSLKAQEKRLQWHLDRGQISRENAADISDRIKEQLSSNPYSTADKTTFRQMEEVDSQTMRRLSVCGMILIGAIIAAFLSCAEQVMVGNWKHAVKTGIIGMLLGGCGGFAVSLFINQLYSALGGGEFQNPWAQQVFARSVAWAILGMFLAIAPGVVMRSGKKFWLGLFGGLIGGLIGGMLFDVIGDIIGDQGWISRFVGFSAIGMVAGGATGIFENAAKQGWLKVVSGLIAGKQFILYRNPTYIGSSPKCEIYLFKDAHIAGRHAAISQAGNDFIIEDINNSGTFVNNHPVSKQRLNNGDEIAVGSTLFVFESKKVSDAR